MTAEAIKQLYEYGAAQVPVQLATGMRPFVVVPNDFKVESLEKLGEFPAHIKQSVTVYHPDSFLQYWNTYATASSMVFADVLAPAIVGILDYHDPGDTHEGQEDHLARWGHHRVTYGFRPTKEWQIWTASNGKRMSQLEFAQFIEDNLDDIAEPPKADMLQMVQHFEAKKDVNFSSGVRLQNNQVQFKYEETITAGGHGNFTVPDTFKLSIAPFEGAENYGVIVRFRYRISQQGLQLHYDILRPHKYIEDAVLTTVAKIQDKLGDKKVLLGAPGA